MSPLLRGRKPALFALTLSLAALGSACTGAERTGDKTMKSSSSSDSAMMKHESFTTTTFAGPKANTGTATLLNHNGTRSLTWSDDFVIPSTPAPHWRVVDSAGNTYLLQRLVIKGDKQNRTVEVPAYVPDVAKVQIWCAYAEVVLGEASFASPVK
jgi:hypothetical protein